MDEIQPFGAIDVHGGTDLALREGLPFAEVGGRGCPVGEGDLRVEGHSDDVGDEDEADAELPGGD